ncbi:FtsX-like permease family protein [Microcystis aeruginosa NIES-298]|uniref:DevC protein n=2 Tax=Microcystis aeruginosa TaxID=1126 RepID=A0A2H6BSC6_MICAE|nr:MULTISPECIES: ABC transporter permease DevC [Microcystis]NCR97796.1 FtsX-like permease family protein [Microcystis aeruginosa L311-01]OCY13760.1 MAG: ABC transporter [Microcystis aeruginosa CACIAM 03]TRU09458.1 MAG: FtsX-like permease family protein [Microcystis aeruginosa Ma_MB_F_20061100_S19D]TRU16551.1 MAG: FtsX-like permease family protein [Microcystis aeruginosa Ma_MB_F_20061100_S19]EPF17097.1 ABC exporter transmembrane subunit, DevC protein [Microcystis aeruginosa SPC777]
MNKRKLFQKRGTKLATAWLQLKHQKVRLLVALSGVIFSVVIIFMQLGIRDALFDSAVRFHQSLQGDIFLISPRSTALIAMKSFPERRLLQSLAFDEVDYVSPIYLDFAQWKNPNTRNYWRNIFVLGINLRHPVLNLPGITENIEKLKMPNTVLFDQGSRSEFGTIAQDFRRDGSVSTELGNPNGNRKVNVVGLFQFGTSFGSDGNLVTSHINFLRIFDNRKKGFIDVGLIKLKPDQDIQKTLEKLRKYLPKDVRVLSKSEFVNFEKKYWQTSTAIGFIFNLGVALGIIVGVVVVYQILYTNVSEHLSEYATLKAMGYRHRYLLSMVLQQAFLIAVLGYIPGFLIANIQYEFTKNATLLPVNMSLDRAVFVFILTLVMAFVSGATAVKKLQDADPADIF